MHKWAAWLSVGLDEVPHEAGEVVEGPTKRTAKRYSHVHLVESSVDVIENGLYGGN